MLGVLDPGGREKEFHCASPCTGGERLRAGGSAGAGHAGRAPSVLFPGASRLRPSEGVCAQASPRPPDRARSSIERAPAADAHDTRRRWRCGAGTAGATTASRRASRRAPATCSARWSGRARRRATRRSRRSCAGDPAVAARRRRSVARRDPRDRVLHARGQSLPDWVALRSGRLGAVPDAVARPADAADGPGPDGSAARTRRRGSSRTAAATSVVGGVTARPSRAPGRHRGSRRDRRACARSTRRSGLATFGAGTTGPAIEAALAPARPDPRPLPAIVRALDGRRLGRDPLGRPAVARLRPDRGPVRRRPPRDAARAAGPADPPGVGGRPGPSRARARLGGAARDPHRRHRSGRRAAPQARAVHAATSCPTGTARWSSPGGWRSPACRCRWSASRRRSRRRRRSRWPATARDRRCCGATSAGAAWARSAASSSSG